MKALVIVVILLVGLGGQAFSMGHPHNMFAARKQLRTKTATSILKTKPSACLTWQHTVQLTKPAFSERIVNILSQIHPTPAY